MTELPGTPDRPVWLDTLQRGALHAAPLLLGATLSVARGGQLVTVRITEVEAYEGERDPGSHAYRGQTARNATMFGPAGHLYCYFTYGMHWCANIVCGTPGSSSAVLLRAGEVTAGLDAVVVRRSAPPGPRLASGPARLAQSLGLGAGDDGTVLRPGPAPSVTEGAPVADGAWLSGVRSRRRPGTLAGPRTGVSGPGGTEQYPWRYWHPSEPSVSPYRAAAPRRRSGAGRSSSA